MSNLIVYRAYFPSTGRSYYFGSIAAMFEELGSEMIGITLNTFYKNYSPQLQGDATVRTPNCRVSRVSVLRKKRE